MDDLPALPTVEPVDLVRLLEERFGSVGVTSPNGRLFVNLAWLYHHSANYLETIRKATQEMADEDGLGNLLRDPTIAVRGTRSRLSFKPLPV